MHMRSLLPILTLVCASLATAGPLEGELFGYRLGSKYTLGNNTRGYFMDFMGQAVIYAEKPEVPTDFVRVELITTPKTFTIANIYAIAEFDNEDNAKAFEARYADLLKTMYGSKCLPLKAYLEESLKLLCSSKFEFTVHGFKPDKSAGKYKVHVGLKFDNNSAIGKKVISQFTTELKKLDAEGKRVRLDKALREQSLKGLQ